IIEPDTNSGSDTEAKLKVLQAQAAHVLAHQVAMKEVHQMQQEQQVQQIQQKQLKQKKQQKNQKPETASHLITDSDDELEEYLNSVKPNTKSKTDAETDTETDAGTGEN